MSCSKYKNCHYKSAVQFYNSNTQPIVLADTQANPAILSLGSKVTDTGVAISFSSSGIDISKTGLYRISADIRFGGGTAGSITTAMTLNGVVLPETVTSETIGAAGTFSSVSIETVRQLNLCCVNTDDIIGFIAYSDGDAIGSVSSISGNVVKLA